MVPVELIKKEKMLNLPELCSNINAEIDNEIIVESICILLNRFSYEFTEEQRELISEVLSENQSN
jgi:hypothetical protein